MDQYIQQKTQLCDIGKQVHAKGFVAANEGNLSIRVAEDRVLITPTMRSKGSLEPDDICTIDFDGRPIDQEKKPSSEYRLHLNVYRERSDVASVVHCHPPHATAFAIAREPIPTGVLPEPDIFLGKIPMAPYATPGNQEFADTILHFVKTTNTIVLASHGTLCYDAELERAFWWTELLDAYCRTLILAKQIGNVTFLSDEQERELVSLRKSWGFEIPK